MAAGRVWVRQTDKSRAPRRFVRSDEFERELARFEAAVVAASDDLRALRSQAAVRASQAELSILDAYVLMLSDPVLYEEVKRRLTLERKGIEWCIEDASESLAARIEGLSDVYLRERGHDIRFVGELLLTAIGSKAPADAPPEEPYIVVAHDLSPAETARFSPELTLALVTAVGTRTSHTAILARALGIPAVVGCVGVVEQATLHERVLVDGSHGTVVLSPEPAEVAAALAADAEVRSEGLRLGLDSAAVEATLSGDRFELLANVELPLEVEPALQAGARGVGLYRTEFLLLERTGFPDEESQFQMYKAIVDSLHGLPVTFRTFDVGGDKFDGFLEPGDRPNPALGMRAVRLGLARPQVLRDQVRALLRAAVHGPLRIMLPMVSTVGEFDAVRHLVDEEVERLRLEGQAPAEPVPLGCMIEVPAAALVADHLARRADFFSVGTNDLVQYVLAVDRAQRDVAYLARALDPAVLRLLSSVGAAAKAAGITAGVCGTLASEPMGALVLFGLGFRSLSVEAAALGQLRAALCRVSTEELEAVAKEACGLASVEEVDGFLERRLGGYVADLIR